MFFLCKTEPQSLTNRNETRCIGCLSNRKKEKKTLNIWKTIYDKKYFFAIDVTLEHSFWKSGICKSLFAFYMKYHSGLLGESNSILHSSNIDAHRPHWTN